MLGLNHLHRTLRVRAEFREVGSCYRGKEKNNFDVSLSPWTGFGVDGFNHMLQAGLRVEGFNHGSAEARV